MIKLKHLLSEDDKLSSEIPLSSQKYEIVDLRDPNWVPEDEFDKKELQKTMINIHDKKIYLYRWGSKGNKLSWHDIIPISKLSDMMTLTKKGNLILPERMDDTKWSGVRNIYTYGTKEWVEILLNNGIINPNTNIYIGNWARQSGEYIGKTKHVIKRELSSTKLPSKLVFYHGTSSDRLEDIKKDGLKPVPLELRAWKSDVLKHHPEYRTHAIYLTFDYGQADYYAEKAMLVARRHGIKNTKKVVLKITIPRKMFRRLLPDDDYLMRQLIELGIDWIQSLKEFSQVAYLGTIPPEWIEIKSVKPYSDGRYKSPLVKEFSC